MPSYICKVNEGGKDYYFEFSTIVDAPVTFGMSREEFEEYYREEYGRRAMDFEFEERMKRVEEKGTSSRIHDNVIQVIQFNRAGKDETRLTPAQLIDAYCVNTEWANADPENTRCPVVGTDPNADED